MITKLNIHQERTYRTYYACSNISKKNYNKVLKLGKKHIVLLKCRGVTRSDFKLYKKQILFIRNKYSTWND